MTTAEEKVLAQGKNSVDSLVDFLINNCSRLPPEMSADDLLLMDRIALLVFIRIHSFSPYYRQDVTCSECGMKFKKSINLEKDINVDEIPDDFVEPYEVSIKGNTEYRVGLGLLRGRDEKAISNYRKKVLAANAMQGDPGYLRRLAAYIRTLDGKDMPINDKLDFVREMPSSCSNILRDAIEEHDYGFNLQIKAKCPSCGEEVSSVMEFSEEFFRPKRDRSEGDTRI
jgi:hypothetical protein